MIRLIFQPERIPRTTTRAQWHEIDRWRRVTQRELCRQAEDQRTQIGLLMPVRPQMAARMAEKLINPAVMIYPEVRP